MVDQQCRQCDYDLTGLPRVGRCPECGQRYNAESGDGLRRTTDGLDRGDRLMRRLRTLGFVAAVLVLFSCAGLGWMAGRVTVMATMGLLALVTLLCAVTSYLYEKDE